MTRARGTVGTRPGRPGLWLRWHEGGKRRVRRAKSDDLEAARGELRDILAALADGSTSAAPSFARFVAETYVPIHRAEVAEQTFQRSAVVIDRFAKLHGTTRISEITVTDVRAYVADRRAEGLAPATLRREVAALSPIFEAAIDAGLMTGNPCRVRIKGVRARRTELLTARRLDEILEAASPTYRAILTLIVDAGLRRGVAIELRWDDLDPKLRAILPSAGANAKRRVPAMPLTARCRRALREIRGAQDDAEERVFPHVTPNGLRLYWERLRERLGLPGWRLHDFRHQFASEALAHGAPHSVVADLLGHSSPALVVKTYGTSTATGAARAAMQALERGRAPRRPRKRRSP